MELQQFFRFFFPISSLDSLREEIFALTYVMKGMTYGDLLEMDSSERWWYLKRLHKQLKKETQEMKQAGKKGRKGRKR